MNCREFNEKLSLYIDNELEDNEKNEFDLHLNKCDECKKSYEEMIKILQLTSEVEDKDLPENYKSSLRSKLELEIKENKKKLNFKLLTSVAACFLLLIVSFGFIIDNINLFGVKQQIMEDNSSQYGAYDEPEASESPTVRNFTAGDKQSEGRTSEDLEKSKVYKTQQGSHSFSDSIESLNESNNRENTGVKIIKEAYLTLEIKKYDNSLNNIVTFVNERNGYIENSETWYYNPNVKSEDFDRKNQLKRGTLRIRIPQQNFDEALKLLNSEGLISSKQTSSRNITQSYYDTENIIKNLEIQEERLREILKKAENVEEILRVENELNRVRTEIDRNKGTIRGWDNLVNYSTIIVSLIETENNTETIQKLDAGILSKAKEGFISTINSIINFLERAFIFLITIIPVIIIIVIFIILVFMIIKRILSKREH